MIKFITVNLGNGSKLHKDKLAPKVNFAGRVIFAWEKKTIKYKQILKDKEKKNYWLRVKVTDNSDS